jgi:hypothetical protein
MHTKRTRRLEKQSGSFKKLRAELAYDPEIPFLSYCLNEWKSTTHPKICAQLFTAALSTISKRWKQPKCPSVWTYKTWYSHTMKFYAAIKRNKILPKLKRG